VNGGFLQKRFVGVSSRSITGIGASIFNRMFNTIYGVDFSGAKLAGRNTWVARIKPVLARRKLSHYLLTDL
jgi:hypothetical protein